LSNTNTTEYWGTLRSSSNVRSSRFTSRTRRATLVDNPVISHEGGEKDGTVITTNQTKIYDVENAGPGLGQATNVAKLNTD